MDINQCQSTINANCYLDTDHPKVNKSTSIAVHGSHDGSVCFIDKSNNVRIFEIERYCKRKHSTISQVFGETWTIPTDDEYYGFLELIKSTIMSPDIDVCYYNNMFEKDFERFGQIFNISSYVKSSHHDGHARSANNQSHFEESLIFSVDGGGHDKFNVLSSFNVYHAVGLTLTKIKEVNLNLGTPYALIGRSISEIGFHQNFNVYAGKLMGLSSYGKVIPKWVDPLESYYRRFDTHNLDRNMIALGEDIKLDTSGTNISGDDSCNLARTSQHVFEYLFNSEFKPVYDIHDLPVCLTGGCALNVTNNQKIKNVVGESNLFIPPNPCDSGLSFGYILKNPSLNQRSHNITFSGIPIQNKHLLLEHGVVPLNYDVLIEHLRSLHVIGVMRGNSECGPRALGHRSLLCHPTDIGMKDRLNSTIKFREWFRPFAPVVRKEDISLYFDDITESKYMSYCPTLKSEFVGKLPSITHIDDTCRVQTVTCEENPFIYELLTRIDSNEMIPVLLNTSFNVKGAPLVNDVKDALDVYNTLPINVLVVDDVMMSK